jgi:hypothetical protein
MTQKKNDMSKTGSYRVLGQGGWLLACGMEHSLIAVCGQEVDAGVVVLGVLSEGGGKSGTTRPDRNTGACELRCG